MKTIRELLHDNTGWRRWVEPEMIERALTGRPFDQYAAMVAAAAVGYELWKERVQSPV